MKKLSQILNETSEDDFKWAEDIQPKLIDLHVHGLLDEGDTVILKGETLDNDGNTVELARAEFTMRYISSSFDSCKAIADIETMDTLDLSGDFNLCDMDKTLVVLGHLKGETINESEEDDLKWMDDTTPKINIDSIEWGGEGFDHQLYYFYPSITREEYIQYVEPILNLSYGSIRAEESEIHSGSKVIDHLEIYRNNSEDRYDGKEYYALGGSVDYFGCDDEECFRVELGSEYITNGREIFNIPSSNINK